MYSQAHDDAHYHEWFNTWFDDGACTPPVEHGWDAGDDDDADWAIAEMEGQLHEDDIMWEVIDRWVLIYTLYICLYIYVCFVHKVSRFQGFWTVVE